MKRHWHTIALLSCCLALFSCQPIDLDKELREGAKAAAGNDWKTALKKAELCLDNAPSSADAAILKSLSLFMVHGNNAEDLEKSLELIRQVTKEHPERYDAFLVHGWILLNKNRVVESIEPLKKAYALHLSPENKNVPQTVQGSINYILGCASFYNNLFPDAEKHLEQALKRTPYKDWASIYSNLGSIAYYQGNVPKAIGYMQKAQKLAPRDYAIAVNMAVLVDFMSYKQYNSKNYQAYAAQKQGWYRNALSCIQEERRKSNNASIQIYLDNLAKAIRKRAKI